ncbi:related to protein cgi-121 [Phialocephala subalpina]|uniref:EKC/KEOPS complex subunit CGI121 n=1 Tax=Phialocephala subalpina TaxID=576137 RepID=A0A1L7WRQ7_9HELO|nr:related to protein cgi-121 [Phialocephala subalpina]
MALLQTAQLEHLPPSHSIHIALYRNIQNAAFLQQQLLDGNTDFEYALIDASVLVSKIHALAAVYRAVNDLLSNRLRSRNVHSEIVFSLSPNNNRHQPHADHIQLATQAAVRVALPTTSTPQLDPSFRHYPPSTPLLPPYSLSALPLPITNSLTTPLEQIAESFRRFGIQPTTTSLLLIKVSTPESPITSDQLSSRLATQIQGEQVPFDDETLASMTDVGRVRKIYKLNSGGGGGKKKEVNGNEVNGVNGARMEREVDERREMEVLILGAMALRGATN